jgi:cation transport protein ChaC
MPLNSRKSEKGRALRAHVIPPERSVFRKLDTASLDAMMRDAGFAADWRVADEVREASRLALLRGRRGSDLWVFAYGSLMWDPAFHFTEVRPASLDGYHRRFCVWSKLGRGTPENPGLMAGLDVGGVCDGLAFRIDQERIEEETSIVWAREMLLPSYTPTFLQASTEEGPVEALAFVVDPMSSTYAGRLSEHQVATCIATGTGVFGSTREYFEKLVQQLGVFGLRDDGLCSLHECVAKMVDTNDE